MFNSYYLIKIFFAYRFNKIYLLQVFTIMIENKFYNSENKKNYNSEMLLKIMKRVLIEERTNTEKEFYVDENWKFNADD